MGKIIRAWKMGESKTLIKKFGKELREVMFLNPATNKEEEFILFGQRDWSVILPITRDGRVITVRQYKQGGNKIMVELPAGTADFKEEKPEEVAKRELLEETGYQSDELISLGSPQWIASRNSWTRFHCFLAVGCEKLKEAKYDASEEIEVKLVPLKRWVEMCRTEIEEPSAIVATFRALLHLNVMPYLK